MKRENKKNSNGLKKIISEAAKKTIKESFIPNEEMLKKIEIEKKIETIQQMTGYKYKVDCNKNGYIFMECYNGSVSVEMLHTLADITEYLGQKTMGLDYNKFYWQA